CPQCASWPQNRLQNSERHPEHAPQTAATARACPPTNLADESRNSTSSRLQPRDAVEITTSVSPYTIRRQPRFLAHLSSNSANGNNPSRFRQEPRLSDAALIHVTPAASHPEPPSHSTDAIRLRQKDSEIVPPIGLRVDCFPGQYRCKSFWRARPPGRAPLPQAVQQRSPDNPGARVYRKTSA